MVWVNTADGAVHLVDAFGLVARPGAGVRDIAGNGGGSILVTAPFPGNTYRFNAATGMEVHERNVRTGSSTMRARRSAIAQDERYLDHRSRSRRPGRVALGPARKRGAPWTERFPPV